MSGATMKAAMLHKNGDPTEEAVLSVVDVPVPEPGQGELLIKVHAASINPIDYKLMKGEVPGKKGGLVGFDVSGIVEKVGPNCSTELKQGDAVYADAAKTKGSFAEFVVVKVEAVARKPTNLDFREAASLPLAGLTALQALVTQGGLTTGGRVAILGGSGGVGSLAVQMAKPLGAEYVMTTGSSVELLTQLGADIVVNYKETSVVEALQGKELDVVFDCVGGLEGWKAAQGGLKPGGKFVTVVGDGDGNGGQGSMVGLISKTVWRKFKSNFHGPGYNFFLTNTSAPAVIADMAKITSMIESGKVKPLLDSRVFELTTESLHEMVKASMSHRTKGKLVMTVAKV